MNLLLVQSGSTSNDRLQMELQAAGFFVETTSHPACPIQNEHVVLVCLDEDWARSTAVVEAVRRSSDKPLPILAHGPMAEWSLIQTVLDAGADDYLPSPCQTPELALRLQILVRSAIRMEGERAAAHQDERLMKASAQKILAGMVARAAHDYNNLIAAVQGNAELALFSATLDPATRRSLEQIRTAATKASALTAQIQAFARSRLGSSTLQPLSLSALLDESRELLRVAVSRNCRLIYELQPGLPLVNGDPAGLRQAAVALAIEASDGLGERGGEVTIRTSASGGRVSLEVGDLVPASTDAPQVRIADAGSFMNAAARESGLAAVQAIARIHSGTVQFERGEVVVFRLSLPAVETGTSPDRPVRSATVLILDADDDSRRAAHRHLRQAGCVIFEASSAGEALEVLNQIGAVLDAVVVDPACTSGPLLARLPDLRIGVRVVAWSAAPEAEALRLLGGLAQEYVSKAAGVAGLVTVFEKNFAA